MCSGKSGCECSAGAREGTLLASVLLEALVTLTGCVVGRDMGTSTLAVHLIKCLKLLYVFLLKKCQCLSERQEGMTKLLLSDMFRHQIKQSATFLN